MDVITKGYTLACCFEKVMEIHRNLALDIMDQLFSFDLHQKEILGLAMMRWQQMFVTISGDYSLRVFDLTTLKCKFTTALTELPLGVTTHPTVPMLAIRFG